MRKYLFTSESVTEGHPDKICDQISDAVLDAVLEQDTTARVACEVSAATGMIIVMGEITTTCYVDIQNIVRDTVRRIGYTNPQYGFDADGISVLTSLNNQSPDIALGVNNAFETRLEEKGDIGAGDQGMMFGFATDETDTFMPMPIYLAHKLTRKLSDARKSNAIPYLRPDGKAQVTVEYENDLPVRVDTVVISTQHEPDVKHNVIEKDIIEYVIKAVIPENLLDNNTKYFINPTGRFVIGGPHGDTGLTGRKIIVDTYGGYARHGGGAFSGKDPTKVDRSASYAARYVAKNLVAAGIAKKIEIQLSYAIGVAKPVSISVDTFGTGKISDETILNIINRHFDLRPSSIIEMLDLQKPIYKQTAAYGHFGRSDIELPWERLDKIDVLKADLFKSA